MLPTCVCGLKFRSTSLPAGGSVSGWEANLNPCLNYTVLVCSAILIPVYFTFAKDSFKDLTQLSTHRKNIPTTHTKTNKNRNTYTHKGDTTTKANSQLSKGTARRATPCPEC